METHELIIAKKKYAEALDNYNNFWAIRWDFEEMGENEKEQNRIDKALNLLEKISWRELKQKVEAFQ